MRPVGGRADFGGSWSRGAGGGQDSCQRVDQQVDVFVAGDQWGREADRRSVGVLREDAFGLQFLADATTAHERGIDVDSSPCSAHAGGNHPVPDKPVETFGEAAADLAGAFLEFSGVEQLDDLEADGGGQRVATERGAVGFRA